MAGPHIINVSLHTSTGSVNLVGRQDDMLSAISCFCHQSSRMQRTFACMVSSVLLQHDQVQAFLAKYLSLTCTCYANFEKPLSIYAITNVCGH